MVKHYPHLPVDLVDSFKKKEGQARKVSFGHIPEFRDIRLQLVCRIMTPTHFLFLAETIKDIPQAPGFPGFTKLQHLET